MSDDDREMDMDSEEDDYGLGDDEHGLGLGDKSNGGSSSKPMTQAEKRAHHNMLERKRRDHIKDSFVSLRDSVPALQGEKSSRAQILKKAAEYIQFMRRKNSAHQHDIEDLKKQNTILENQIRALERARLNGGGRNGNPSPTDLKPSLSLVKNVPLKTRSSESENSDVEFRNSSSPESNSNSNSATSSTSTSKSNSNANFRSTKKLKVLNPVK